MVDDKIVGGSIAIFTERFGKFGLGCFARLPSQQDSVSDWEVSAERIYVCEYRQPHTLNVR